MNFTEIQQRAFGVVLRRLERVEVRIMRHRSKWFHDNNDRNPEFHNYYLLWPGGLFSTCSGPKTSSVLAGSECPEVRLSADFTVLNFFRMSVKSDSVTDLSCNNFLSWEFLENQTKLTLMVIGVEAFLVFVTAPGAEFLDDLVKNILHPRGERLVWPRFLRPLKANLLLKFFRWFYVAYLEATR